MSKTTKLTLFILISFLLPMAALFLQSRITNDTVNLLLFGVQAAYYYDTMFGPAGITIGYSNRTEKPYVFLNLGFVF